MHLQKRVSKKKPSSAGAAPELKSLSTEEKSKTSAPEKAIVKSEDRPEFTNHPYSSPTTNEPEHSSDESTNEQAFYQTPDHSVATTSLQPQKLFDLNQLTEEEKVVLSASGSARLYQANSQDEIDAIMLQVLNSKTTDTILIVSPLGRQIVSCNENGDQIITRVMAPEHQSADRPGGAMIFHEDSTENSQLNEPVLDYSGMEQHHRQPVYGSSGVIYEKNLTPDQIEMLHEQNLRKPERDMEHIYSEQVVAQQQPIMGSYDNNNNANHMPREEEVKSGHSSACDNDKGQEDIIYHGTPTSAGTPESAGMNTFIENNGMPSKWMESGSQNTLYEVQDMVPTEEVAIDLQSDSR